MGAEINDIIHAKAPGTAPELGAGNSGLQKQRTIRRKMVRAERDYKDHLLPMGTGSVGIYRDFPGSIGTGTSSFCGVAST